MNDLDFKTSLMEVTNPGTSSCLYNSGLSCNELPTMKYNTADINAIIPTKIWNIWKLFSKIFNAKITGIAPIVPKIWFKS